jgi:DNA invertase Pin-like site-specific DNA recombinase
LIIQGDNMIVRIYVRASNKEQDAERALDDLVMFSKNYGDKYVPYVENHTGTKLERPELTKLLNESNNGDILLVESVDRLSRLTQKDFDILKERIKQKGLRLIVADIPTTHVTASDNMTGELMSVINSMLIDLLATMARLDNEKRKERIKQGLQRSGYKPTGKKADTAKHERIKALLATGAMTKEEIAKVVDCGIATVYRIAKES